MGDAAAVDTGVATGSAATKVLASTLLAGTVTICLSLVIALIAPVSGFTILTGAAVAALATGWTTLRGEDAATVLLAA